MAVRKSKSMSDLRRDIAKLKKKQAEDAHEWSCVDKGVLDALTAEYTLRYSRGERAQEEAPVEVEETPDREQEAPEVKPEKVYRVRARKPRVKKERS